MPNRCDQLTQVQEEAYELFKQKYRYRRCQIWNCWRTSSSWR